jgi:hypothetical protein
VQLITASLAISLTIPEKNPGPWTYRPVRQAHWPYRSPVPELAEGALPKQYIYTVAHASGSELCVLHSVSLLLLISVFFRVNPWLCWCVFLVLFPCFSVFVRGKLSLLIVFISVEFCFNRWISSASYYSSCRGLFFCCPSSILPVFIKKVQKCDVSSLCVIQNRKNRTNNLLFRLTTFFLSDTIKEC